MFHTAARFTLKVIFIQPRSWFLIRNEKGISQKIKGCYYQVKCLIFREMWTGLVINNMFIRFLKILIFLHFPTSTWFPNLMGNHVLMKKKHVLCNQAELSGVFYIKRSVVNVTVGSPQSCYFSPYTNIQASTDDPLQTDVNKVFKVSILSLKNSSNID